MQCIKPASNAAWMPDQVGHDSRYSEEIDWNTLPARTLTKAADTLQSIDDALAPPTVTWIFGTLKPMLFDSTDQQFCATSYKKRIAWIEEYSIFRIIQMSPSANDVTLH
ncbi:MAG: hypothetical protein AAFN13_06560 [Bacteroidota bacterium]